VRGCCSVPGQLVACTPGALASFLERVAVRKELVDCFRKTGDVAGRHNTAGVESPHGLGDAADVVRHGGNAGAERTQKRAALVELRPVGEDGNGRVAEGTVDLGRPEVAETPFDIQPIRSCAVRLDRLEGVARDEQPRATYPSHGLDRVAEPLVRSDHPEGEHRATVVPSLRLAREHRVGDDLEPLPLDAEPGERLPAVLAVHDDTVEARKEPAPEVDAMRGSAGKQVVGRENGGQVRSEEEGIELRRRQPLDVEDVRAETAERGEPERVLGDLERQAQRRSAEDTRRERIEELSARISVRLRHGAEAKAGRHELDVGAGPRERRRELMVVRRREGRRIGEQDAHGFVRYVVAMLVRTWNLFHGNASPPQRRAFLRTMIELVTHDRPDVVCLQELPVWALGHLERWSGMHASGAVARRPLLPLGAQAITNLHHGLLRSALTGEADAILTREPAREQGVHIVGSSRLRRIAQVVDFEGVTVVNFHIDGERAQFDRVLAFARGRSIVAGDANLLAPLADGFSPPLEGSIDQILVLGLALRDGPSAWPPERRVVEGRLLSDHAPVEAVVE
jgi:Endonuclease/Exonuclease/phosphatase family